MKTTNKYLLLLLLAATMSTVIFGFTKMETTKEIVTVRTAESVGTSDSSITTVYPNGEIDKVELEKMVYKDLSTNLISINGHLNSIISKGYDLTAVSGGASDGMIVTTYTFTKD